MIKAIETVYKGYSYSGKLPDEPKKKISDRANIAGKRFGRLTAVEDLGIIATYYRLWGCVCDCGIKKAVSSRELRRGHTQSCGCLFLENLRASGGRNKKPVGISAFNQLYFNYRKSARERNYSFILTEDEFKSLTQGDCYYCGVSPFRPAPRAKGTNGDYIYNGIDRIDNSKGYTLDNVRSCCKQCNIAKGVLSEAEFYEWIGRITARQARFERH